MKCKNEKGFGVVEILITTLIILLLVFVGWFTYSHHKNNTPSNNKASTQKQKTNMTQTSLVPDSNKNFFVVKEWGLSFNAPSGISDIRYAINSDTLAFFAKPAGSSFQYRSDYDKYQDHNFTYALGVLYRSKVATMDKQGDNINGKKIGSYYYYTEWSFSSLATGAACVDIYGDSNESNCLAAAQVFQLINQGDKSLLNSIAIYP
jgi:hypothetical protein